MPQTDNVHTGRNGKVSICKAKAPETCPLRANKVSAPPLHMNRSDYEAARNNAREWLSKKAVILPTDLEDTLDRMSLESIKQCSDRFIRELSEIWYASATGKP